MAKTRVKEGLMRGKTTAKIRLFQRTEMEQILSYLPPQTQLPIMVATNLGLTGPEVTSLPWKWVDLTKGEIFVKWSPHVTGRYILLPEAIIRCLATHKNLAAPSDKVFARPDGSPILRNTLSIDFKTACLKAGIPNGSFGDVRLSNVKWLLDAGVSRSVVAARLGMNRHTIQRHFEEMPTRSKDIREVLDSIIVLPPPNARKER